MQSISACLSSGFGKLCKSNIILLTIFRDYLSKCWLATSILAVATNFGTYETSIDLNAPCHEVGISAQWRDTIVANWFTLWGGDYSYLNKTVTPDFQLYQDRIPTGNGSVPVVVNNSSSFLAFVKDSRAGFEKYGFRDDLHFGEDNLVTVRWTLDAVFAGSKTATLKAGSQVAYNGTDIMILNRCHGLIQQVLSAQDFITYFHVLGEPIGTL